MTWIDTGSTLQFNTGFTGTVAVLVSSWMYLRMAVGGTAIADGFARMCIGIQILDGSAEVHSYKNDCVTNQLENSSAVRQASSDTNAATFSNGFIVSLSKNKTYTAKIWFGYRWNSSANSIVVLRAQRPFVQITPCVN